MSKIFLQNFLEHSWRELEGAAGAKYLEKCPVNEIQVKKDLKVVLDEGISSVAVVLAHSYACPEHELRIGQIAKDLGIYTKTKHSSRFFACIIVLCFCRIFSHNIIPPSNANV